MSNSIVLGHPYEGAFYWLMSAENWRKTSIKSSYEGNHPYYKTLYGKNPGKYVDETASLSVLYDRIYLAPADCFLPDYTDHTDGRCYNNPEIGVISDWNWIPDSKEFRHHEELVLRDISDHRILGKVPRHAWPQVVRGIIVQLAVAHRYQADVMGNAHYLRLCKRIQNLTGAYENAKIPEIRSALVNSLQRTFQISSLEFSLKSLDDFCALRQNKTLQKYALSFREHVEKLPLDPQGEYSLLRSMMDAIETGEISKRIAGGLDIAATLSNYVSLIPVVGTAAAAVGIAADHGSQAADYYAERKKWWLLAPEISKTLTKARIEKRMKELEKAKQV